MMIPGVSKCSECGGVANSLDPSKCMFHAASHLKGCTAQELSQALNPKLQSGAPFNLRGFVFPPDFEFPKIVVKSDVDFTDAVFDTGIIELSSVKFCGRVVFRENKFNGTLLFEDVVFDPQASLQFIRPVIPYDSRTLTTIVFRRTIFPPNSTFFREIRLVPELRNEFGPPVIVFRGCCLKDTYFDNCDMGLVSFFNSSFFENSTIVACTWPSSVDRLWKRMKITEHTRQYLISEEWLIRFLNSPGVEEDKKESLCLRYDIPRNFSFREVGSIYRRIKTSLDNIKAYEEAAWLYFNEIEMRRLSWAEESRLKSWKRLGSKIPPTLWNMVYNFYKVTAGYGERPLNCIFSFFAIVILFAILHLLNGIEIGDRVVNYDFSINPATFSVVLDSGFWSDFFEALKLAILRSVPTGYFPSAFASLTSAGHGLLDLMLSLMNTISLTLLIIFTGVSLKRHFKRF